MLKGRKKIMKILIKTTDVFRVDDEEEAVKLIEEYKGNQLSEGYTLTKSGYVLKNKKSKGQVVDSWALVNLERTFNE